MSIKLFVKGNHFCYYLNAAQSLHSKRFTDLYAGFSKRGFDFAMIQIAMIQNCLLWNSNKPHQEQFVLHSISFFAFLNLYDIFGKYSGCEHLGFNCACFVQHVQSKT